MKHHSKIIKVGSEFSGVGAFEFAMKRIAARKGFEVRNLFACDWDKYARESFLANHEKPEAYPKDVNERPIPDEQLDIFMSSPPCQTFSLSGLREGKEDKRGIQFFNSFELIKQNKPRFFIFENVRGLHNHDGGKTFQEWLNLLGGKSVNGLPVIFPYDESVPYHIYWTFLNSKDFDVPQNRERIFIIGIRDDEDNNFTFPIPEHPKMKLKDILEDEVEEKHNLSLKMLEKIIFYNKEEGVIAHLQKGGQRGKVIAEESDFMLCLSATDYAQPKQIAIKIRSAVEKGFESAGDGDSINFAHATSTTRRGRVGKAVAQTIDTHGTIGVVLDNGETWRIRRLTPRECFRLQDFPEDFKFVVSDTQLYKQAGNSITVKVLEKIIERFNL